jgi:hypothetical protein
MIKVTWDNRSYLDIIDPTSYAEDHEITKHKDLTCQDYDKWLSSDDFWSISTAILLLKGIDPENVNLEQATMRIIYPHEVKLSLFNRAKALMEAICLKQVAATFTHGQKHTPTIPRERPSSQFYRDALARETAGALLKPQDVVKWAHSKGFEIPEPLKVLLGTKPAPAEQKKPIEAKKKKTTQDERALITEINELYEIYKKSGWKPRSLYQAYENKKFIPVIIKDWMLKNTQPNPIPKKYLKRNFQNRFKKLVRDEKKKNEHNTK